METVTDLALQDRPTLVVSARRTDHKLPGTAQGTAPKGLRVSASGKTVLRRLGVGTCCVFTRGVCCKYQSRFDFTAVRDTVTESCCSFLKTGLMRSLRTFWPFSASTYFSHWE